MAIKLLSSISTLLLHAPTRRRTCDVFPCVAVVKKSRNPSPDQQTYEHICIEPMEASHWDGAGVRSLSGVCARGGGVVIFDSSRGNRGFGSEVARNIKPV